MTDRIKEATKGGQTRISVRDLKPKQYRWILAIDPNCSLTDPSQNKSGLATLNTQNRSLFVHFYTFPEVIDALQTMKTNFAGAIDDVLILIEGGWLVETNFHLHTNDTCRTATRKGKDVGRNHQTGILLAEMARHLGYDVEIIKPLPKHWKGKDKKVTHEELTTFVDNLPSQTNQDERDAILLAYHRAGFPVGENPKAEMKRILTNYG